MNEPVSLPTAGPSNVRRTFSLMVIQQPARARMCGFGDKDRRPISPPVIVKLTLADPATAQEVGVESIDPTFLVLAADLRGPNGFDDLNLVQRQEYSASRLCRSSTNSTRSPSQHSRSDNFPPSPSISVAVLPVAQLELSDSRPLSRAEARPADEGSPAHLAAGLPGLGLSPSRSPPAQPSPTGHSERLSPTALSPSAAKRRRSSPPPPAPPIPYARFSRPSYAYQSATSSMNDSSTEEGRDPEAGPVPNLIGTLHTNANKLRDLDGEMGLYFVLPDLSVRTEGAFRLRLRLVDLRQSMHASTSQSNVTVLTDEFQVFTAKRFTGMLDPTPLSQCFAKQGVRIPTRRAAKAKKTVGAGDKVKPEEA